MSEAANFTKSLFWKVLARLLMALLSLGTASTNSFSLSLNTGISMQTRATIARTMKQAR